MDTKTKTRRKRKKVKRNTNYDWDTISKEYVESPFDISLSDLALKYDIPIGTLKTTSANKGWAAKREVFKKDPEAFYKPPVVKTEVIYQPAVEEDIKKAAKLHLLDELQKKKDEQIKEISDLCDTHIAYQKVYLKNAFEKIEVIDEDGEKTIEFRLKVKPKDYESITRAGVNVLKMREQIDNLTALPKQPSINLTKQDIHIHQQGQNSDSQIDEIEQEIKLLENNQDDD
jgi:hypothetical protein